jgi:hypothetical protein
MLYNIAICNVVQFLIDSSSCILHRNIYIFFFVLFVLKLNTMVESTDMYDWSYVVNIVTSIVGAISVPSSITT